VSQTGDDSIVANGVLEYSVKEGEGGVRQYRKGRTGPV